MFPSDIGCTAADPQPHVVLRRGCTMAIGANDLVKVRERVRSRRSGQAPPEVAPKGDHQVDAARGHPGTTQPSEGIEDFRLGDIPPDIELEEVVRSRSLGEDSELRKEEPHFGSSYPLS